MYKEKVTGCTGSFSTLFVFVDNFVNIFLHLHQIFSSWRDSDISARICAVVSCLCVSNCCTLGFFAGDLLSGAADLWEPIF